VSLSQHLRQFSGLLQFLHVCPASDKLPIDKHSRHTSSSCHVSENVLNLVAVGTILQLDGQESKVDLLELLQLKFA
jgi:hypothetical protein